MFYFQCYYALTIIGQLEENESILIHSGTAAVGMAAISIALSMNCEIYTTVATTDHKEFLKTMFPKLKEENIGSTIIL